jgi:hypothetical protein
MSHFTRVSVMVRRVLVQHPWIYWLVVVLIAIGAFASMLDRSGAVDDARSSWGDTAIVLIAAADHHPGDAINAAPREVPLAMVPESAVSTSRKALVARQNVAIGEIVTNGDVVAQNGPQAFAPDGWLIVPIVESPYSGAQLGDRVQVVSDGFVVSVDAQIVGSHDDVTLVAVPADEAPFLPAAAAAGGLTLLLVP